MELQRASAGSGKTFHLAKTFIRDFLTTHTDIDAGVATLHPDDKVWEGTVRRYVLREPAEIREAHSHILAITFTNKATNEMKERIVDKLADLARGHRLTKNADGTFKEAEYMDFFLTRTVTAGNMPPTRGQVMATAEAALAELLNNYSDFNISTIDSFFQQILRTFAYELDLNDNLEIELDSDYLTSVGVDMTLRSANRPSDPDHTKAKEWLKQLIAICQGEAAKWDILSSKGTRESGLHKELIRLTANAGRESFRDRLKELRQYFRSPDWNGTSLPGAECFRRYYSQASAYYTAARRDARQKCDEAVSRLDTLMALHPEAASEIASAALTVVGAFRCSSPPDACPEPPHSQMYQKLSSPQADADVAFKSKPKSEAADRQAIGNAIIDVVRNGNSLIDACLIATDVMKHLFFVGLLGLISDNMERFRESNNLLPLADTNGLLHKIVESQADAPFIFERLGALVNHFMIDEFQDTSTQQWEVMRPLVANAESQGFDNLIIGDAKQSIYRFRNAEPELISTGIEADFPCTNARSNPTPNTNWRSSSTVVEFNNELFTRLAADMDASISATSRPDLHRRSPAGIYRNVRQKAHHAGCKGYVQVTFGKAKEYVASLGQMIEALIEDGWAQRDIAVLCDTNSECHDIIDSLLAYNRTAPSTPIEIVSEEALSVSESRAVKMILAVLTIVSRGNLPDNESSDGSMPRLPREAMEMYAAVRIGSGPATIVTEIDGAQMTDIVSAGHIDEMIASMPAISLPALVDAIVSDTTLIPGSLRVTDAAYIAAFQDCVIDFCERYPADPASFLKWWAESGHKVNVAAPEGDNAVTVMTIHKSKGLEFGCVIVPKASWDIDIGKRQQELMWVAPDPAVCSDPRIMPPVVPVNVGTAAHELLRTPYAAAYIEEYDRSRIDRLNEAYVAFTRAGGELYINAEVSTTAAKELAKGKPFSSASLGIMLYRQLLAMSQADPDRYSFDGTTFTAGTRGAAPASGIFSSRGHGDDEGGDSAPDATIREYYVNSPMPKLRSVAGDDTQGAVDDSHPTPRDYGNLLHAIMSGITTPADIDRSIMRLRVRGLLTSELALRCRRRIMQAVTLPEAAEWFAPGLKVMPERAIMRGNGQTSRPDRVIDTGDRIIVIDYKTGMPSVPAGHFAQVRRYMELWQGVCRAAGMERAVEGHLLYIPADDTLPCMTIPVPPPGA